MSNITVIADSTSDIPRKFVDEHKIKIIPLTVHFGDEEYRDWYDFTTEEFYEKLKKSNAMPTTSQVTPHSFVEAFRDELEKGNSIISIHLSSKLSGTYQAAVTAKHQLGASNIEVVDSKGVSFGVGLIVLEATRMADNGMSLDEIAKRVKTMCGRQRYIFSVDTLEYLKRGGRLSSAKATMGTVFNIKPILEVREGVVEVVDRVRGRKKVVPKLVEMVRNEHSDLSDQVIAVGHAAMPDMAQELAEALKDEFHPKDVLIAGIGSVIGTHAGPGTIGLFYQGK